jgi:signal transduction histidine kinase
MQEMEKYFLIIIWGTVLLVLIIVISIMFLLQYQKRHKKFIDQQNNFTQTLLQSQLEIQEKTLKNISQEIHDNIGQVLSLVKLNLFTMDIDDKDSLSTKIDNSKELVSKAIIDLRDLSHSMNTDYIEEKGLVKAIEYELEMIRKTGTIKTDLQIKGTVVILEKNKELIIFRILQECLQNAIKHSRASCINTTILFEKEKLRISIIDNGIGFDVQNISTEATKKGMGIYNMYKKADLIIGNLRISSEINKGCQTELVIKY